MVAVVVLLERPGSCSAHDDAGLSVFDGARSWI